MSKTPVFNYERGKQNTTYMIHSFDKFHILVCMKLALDPPSGDPRNLYWDSLQHRLEVGYHEGI
jgi:hypothetical protein